MDDRGQLYTLEGITAGLVILLGLFFALQATTATPGATGTLNPHAEQQDRVSAQAVLNGANASTLRDVVLYWDHAGSNPGFRCSPSFTDHYPGYAAIADGTGASGAVCDEDVSDTTNPSPGAEYAAALSGGDNYLPPNGLGKLLNERFGEGYVFNVVVKYHDSSVSDGFAEQLMVYQGQPDASGVRATATVTLMDDDVLRDAQGKPTSTAIGDDPSNFYAPDEGSSDFYNRLYVEVVVWRG